MNQHSRPEASIKGTVVIAGAWLLVRLAMSFLVHPMIVSDQLAYLESARDFIATHGAVLARRSPAYVAFLSATFWLGPRGIYALQSLMTLAAALLTQRRLGFWQGLATAICPFFAVWEWSVLTETLRWTAVWVGWLLIFYRRRPADIVIGGLFMALAVLTRPLLLLLPLLAGALLLWKSQRRGALTLLAAAYLPVAAVVPLVSGPSFVGENLWIGSWERNPGWTLDGWTWPAEAGLTPDQRSKLLVAHEAVDDRPFLDAALERYRTEPLQAVASWFVRYPYFWIGTRSAFSTLPIGSLGWFLYKSFMWLLNAAILLLGVIGGIRAIRSSETEAMLVPPVAYVALIYLPFHNTETRYSIVALPFLIALGIGWIVQAASRSSSSAS